MYMNEVLKSIEWMAFPPELKQTVINAYEKHHQAVFGFDADILTEAEHNCKIADKEIHKALGLNLEYLPSNLEKFITDLRSLMKTAYNIFQVEETDPLMNKIINHMEKFKTIKSAAIRQAELNINSGKENSSRKGFIA